MSSALITFSNWSVLEIPAATTFSRQVVNIQVSGIS
jgi:hypothetical protein